MRAHPVRVVGEFFGHFAVVVTGFVLMVGLALGVTMVLLPVGIVVSFLGALILLAELLMRTQRRARNSPAGCR